MDTNLRLVMKTKTKMFPDNFVDKEVQLIFRPVNLMQIVLLSPKYRIKNDRIYSHNCFYRLILFSGTLMYLSVYIHRIVEIATDINFRRYTEVNFFFVASFFDFGFRCLGFIMNFVWNYTKTKKSVLFVLYFQEVHRFINNEISTRRYVIGSWIGVSLIFGYYIILICFFYFNTDRPPWNVVLYLMLIICFDINTIYAIRLVKLLTDKVVLWDSQLLLVKKNGCSRFYCVKLYYAYVQIIKCYKIIEDIYGVPILYQILEAFFQSLVNVQLLIAALKFGFIHKGRGVYLLLLISSFAIKAVAAQIKFTMSLNEFYKAVHSLQRSCLYISVLDCTDDQRRLCKNVLRLHRASFSKLRVCGMFYVDVCYPLRLVVLLTNYIIVLLQFAFL